MAGTNSNLQALPTDSPNHKWNVDIYGPGLITANSWLLETVEMYINGVQVEKVNIVKYLADILCKDGSSTVDILHQDRNNYSSNGWELRMVWPCQPSPHFLWYLGKQVDAEMGNRTDLET